ncbi:probable G-protein coupled receptor No18 [Dendronephthya gigantea]|uniref:probable G-protein coupled receptor No18 n=1 Tax=Dendronephthya gigantea TaxID=151771 RepID=UPI00106D713E|nr:probable G-protein coupled receptor No18 [Dendronephthya gigantea]XP_028408303.1 probable G-protein coupled receptor No18 [Dendronephthya gigantea]XP_028408304.1 probable G-protein coupled receptor No18 [Dendronephthya gigantea]XP_028408305.1 probable G-protein coupled receptor No18 [Dendronephthya gigantea]XP_028408306.1 probable G-protein coupled receptor No18 [Dendronephthya gigantea]XP_028408307.1 probable G-protein coupled receptor No18 [Dendronephthya gigantea]
MMRNLTLSTLSTAVFNKTLPNLTCSEELESTTEEAMRYFISVCLAIIITISIAGNLMVVIAFKVNKHLQTVSNSFILSLAASDLITTIFVMPYDLHIILTKHVWEYGETLCKFYTTVYLISAPASTLNLLAVSIDRFRLIRDPFAYKRQTTPFRALLVVMFIWVYSTIIALLPLMGWQDSTPWPDDTNPNCTVRDNKNTKCYFAIAWHYSVMVSVLNFVIPPLIMSVIYFRIYLIAKGHIERIHRLESATPNGRASLTGMTHSANNSRRSSRAGSCSPIQIEMHFNGSNYLTVPHANGNFPPVGEKDVHANHKNGHEHRNSLLASTDFKHARVQDEHAKAATEHAKMDTEHEEIALMHERKNSTNGQIVTAHERKNSTMGTTEQVHVTRRNNNGKRKSRLFSINGTSMLRKNLKAAKSLAIIVGAFFLCWYPHTIVSMVVNSCIRLELPCTLPPVYVENLLLIIGFVNSMINPFLYGLHNKEFKKTYKRILRWK